MIYTFVYVSSRKNKIRLLRVEAATVWEADSWFKKICMDCAALIKITTGGSK